MQTVANQGGRVVKALDLSSNVRMHTWVRTPFLVMGPWRRQFFRRLFIFYLSLFRPSDSFSVCAFAFSSSFQSFSRFLLELRSEVISMETFLRMRIIRVSRTLFAHSVSYRADQECCSSPFQSLFESLTFCVSTSFVANELLPPSKEETRIGDGKLP